MNILEARRRTLGKGVYKKTVEGNPAIAQGSLARRYPGITMQGWTEQAQYEGKNLFDFKALTIPNDRTIIYNPIYLGDGTFTLSTDFKDSSGEFALYILPGNVQEGAGTPNGVDRSASKTVVSSEGYVTVAYRRATDLSNPLESDIMLNSGSTALPYEPYTGGQPSPNPDYPQEIVSAGNYDEGTGKYQYEINVSDAEENPTKSQTVTITSDRPLTKWDRLEKRGGQWGWVYKSKQIILNGTILNIIGNGTWGNIDDYKTIAFYSYINGTNNSQDIGVDMSRAKEALTNQFIYGYVYNSADVNKFTIVSSIGYIAFRVDADMLPDWSSEAPSNQPFIDWLDEKEQAGKPVTLLYPTIEETFAPLSASEQEQMNELYTFRPTTVLSNDAGCEMSLTYKTKKSLEVTT